MDENFQAAFRLMTSREAREAFDLSKEPPAMRERYGMNRFGQCCLLARRLVEAGVRFVTINTFLTVFDEITWDIHGTKPFTSIEGMKNIVAPMYDQAYSALIEDLDQRGMLDATLVCNLAEFGRTPRVNPAGGRDHWPQCLTCYFAGGGVKGGRVVGSSDPIGAVPAERPVEPAEVVATIFHSLGLDLETNAARARPAGRSRWSIRAIAKSTNCFRSRAHEATHVAVIGRSMLRRRRWRLLRVHVCARRVCRAATSLFPKRRRWPARTRASSCWSKVLRTTSSPATKLPRPSLRRAIRRSRRSTKAASFIR